VDVINEEYKLDSQVCPTYFQNASLLVDMKHKQDPLLIKFEKKVHYVCLYLF
jgi:hypothetical protein